MGKRNKVKWCRESCAKVKVRAIKKGLIGDQDVVEGLFGSGAMIGLRVLGSWAWGFSVNIEVWT